MQCVHLENTVSCGNIFSNSHSGPASDVECGGAWPSWSSVWNSWQWANKQPRWPERSEGTWPCSSLRMWRTSTRSGTFWEGTDTQTAHKLQCVRQVFQAVQWGQVQRLVLAGFQASLDVHVPTLTRISEWEECNLSTSDGEFDCLWQRGAARKS